MNELEINSFLTCDYIYIPYDDKDKINLRNTGMIYKGDHISDFKNKKQYSPVSGKAYGLSTINTLDGNLNVLIIENDFKDKTYKKPISIKDIYELEKSKILELTEGVGLKNNLTLVLTYDYDYDIKDEYLLKDNIKEVLETLNIIDQTYENLTVKIRLNKRDIMSYQTLFSYLGTYPNIEIEFNKTDENETCIFIYDVLNIYDNLKNKIKRDYIYVSVKNNSNITIVKTKRNSNLKDLLVHLNIMSTKILINEKLKIESANFLLDENIKTVNIY